MRAIEQGLALVDRVLAVVPYLAAVVVGTMGLMMGLLVFSEKGDLGGHGFTPSLCISGTPVHLHGDATICNG